MSYNIVFNKAVANQLKRLPGYVKAIARQQIAALSDQPRLPQSQELDGHPGYFRVWLSSNYRLVWQVDDEMQTVRIRYVGPKTPDLYRTLGLSHPPNGDDDP
jgi:mRNA-degrading endonuclease RelE of RelBE toxin-antitoxin system